MHAVQDRLPGVRELVDAMFAYYRINAEKGATFLLKLVENHELSTLSRREYIDELITEVVRSRKRDVAADVVNECKLYAFMDALSRQGDEVVREVVWKRASMIESLVKEFCQAIESACQSKMENIPMFLGDDDDVYPHRLVLAKDWRRYVLQVWIPVKESDICGRGCMYRVFICFCRRSAKEYGC